MERRRSSPISTSPSAPPASTSTRTRRKASRKRCSRPNALDANLIDRLLSKCGDNCRSARRAGDARSRLRSSRKRPSTALIDIVARLDALDRARPAARLDRLDAAHAGRRRRSDGRRRRPDLANLRNAKNMIDNLRAARPNDPPPRWSSTASACRSGRKSRPPISPRRSKRSRAPIIPHDAKLFGTAANNGQMIAEMEDGAKNREFSTISRAMVTGRGAVKREAQGFLEPLLAGCSEDKSERDREFGEDGNERMFGKRSAEQLPGPRAQPPASRPPRGVERDRRRPPRRRRSHAGRRAARPPAAAQSEERRSDDYYQTKSDDFRRADRGDRPGGSWPSSMPKARARKSATSSTKSSRSRMSCCRSPSRRTCSTTSATTCSATGRSSRCWRATTSPTSWSTAPTRTFIEVGGKIQLTNVRFRDNAQLMNICQRIVSQVGRRVDEASPICDARLLDGSRVNVIAPPLAIDGAALTIRKFKKDKLTLDQLVRFGSISPAGARNPQDHRPRALQRHHFRRHRLGQDDAAQLPDPLHRPRRARHHLRRRGRTATAAAARGAAGDAPAQPRRRRAGHDARSGQELPAHASRAHHRRRSARTGGVRPVAGDEHRPRRLDGHAARQLAARGAEPHGIDDHHGRLSRCRRAPSAK